METEFLIYMTFKILDCCRQPTVTRLLKHMQTHGLTGGAQTHTHIHILILETLCGEWPQKCDTIKSDSGSSFPAARSTPGECVCKQASFTS